MKLLCLLLTLAHAFAFEQCGLQPWHDACIKEVANEYKVGIDSWNLQVGERFCKVRGEPLGCSACVKRGAVRSARSD